MSSLTPLVLLAALSGTPDTVVLQFTASWCQPCREMEADVTQLINQGIPIQKIDVDQQRALAQQYRVEQIPCFVAVANGREVGRRTASWIATS